MLANGASSTTIDNYSVNTNGVAGLHLLNAQATLANHFDAKNNTVYGIWMDSSSHSEVLDGTITGNGLSGYFLGCSQTGPGGACSSGPPQPTTFSLVEHAFVGENGAYGVAIDLGDDDNIIDGDLINTNNTLPPGFDTFDANPMCASNLWFNNGRNTPNMSCD